MRGRIDKKMDTVIAENIALAQALKEQVEYTMQLEALVYKYREVVGVQAHALQVIEDKYSEGQRSTC
jgi:hypothetical protein